MTKEESVKLLKYLYPTKEILNFMCNDLYEELKEIVPLDLCFNEANKSEKNRNKNLNFISLVVLKFLRDNPVYKNKIMSLYKTKELSINDLIIGFIFYVTTTNEEYKHIDIFKDKKSICYSDVLILNILLNY